MLSARRIITEQLPPKIQYLNDNSYYYNYDIVQTQSEREGEPITQYNFVQVHLWGKPNYKDCVKAVIRSYLTIDEEFDLINSINKATLGLDVSTEDVDKYKEYVCLLNNIKLNVSQDFK